MATIDNLRVSILNMSEEDGFALIRRIRDSRRTPPPVPKKAKKASTAKKQAKPKKTADQLVDEMSPAQKAALLKQLTGG